MIYFVDTSAFYAAKDPSDKHFKEATEFLERIKTDVTSFFVTSNFVFDETMTLVRMKLGHDAAVRYGKLLWESDIVSFVNVNEDIEARAWTIFEHYADKDFSYTDCTSFAIMEAEKLTRAFAFDKHFAQYGFVTVP